MYDRIQSFVDGIEDKIIEDRRDFHRYPESAWTEFRTASQIAKRLIALGYDVKLGRDVINDVDRMGVPSEEMLTKHYQRALSQGADPGILEQMEGGFTGVVATLENGEGPTVGLRFDIDAVDVCESTASDHLPRKEGFSSINESVMHACGHDGHAAIGLAVAETLMAIKGEIEGKVKLIFQPAEEGVRGAKSMTTSGELDDIDFMLGGHIGLKEHSSGTIYCGVGGFLATTKFDAYFTGVPTHAGGSPEKGKNALLAAATAALNLNTISRHSEGATRINVGKLTAGTGRNVIPANAHMAIETRGVTSELNDYMTNHAERVLKSAATMYDVDLEIKFMGAAKSAESNQALITKAKALAPYIKEFDQIVEDTVSLGGSEDYSYMMKKVQESGGESLYMIFGSDIKASHHHHAFDFNEGDLKNAVKMFAIMTYDILKK